MGTEIAHGKCVLPSHRTRLDRFEYPCLEVRRDDAASETRITSYNVCYTKLLRAYAEDEMLDYATRSKAAAYLVKPYNKRQILATLRLLVHGEENTPQVDTVKLIDGYRFDMSDEQLYFRDTQVKLGPRARRLLALLCRTPGASVSNSQISMHIWRNNFV